MSFPLRKLTERARRCPLACSTKILFLVLFIIALYIACFYQQSMSKHVYAGFVIAIGYLAVLAIVAGNNCWQKPD